MSTEITRDAKVILDYLRHHPTFSTKSFTPRDAYQDMSGGGGVYGDHWAGSNRFTSDFYTLVRAGYVARSDNGRYFLTLTRTAARADQQPVTEEEAEVAEKEQVQAQGGIKIYPPRSNEERVKGGGKRVSNSLTFSQKSEVLKCLLEKKNEFLQERPTYEDAAKVVGAMAGFRVTLQNLRSIMRHAGVKWSPRRERSIRNRPASRAGQRAVLSWLVGVVERMGEQVPDEIRRALGGGENVLDSRG